MVPVPEAKDLAALNEQLLAACVANRDRTISGKSMTIGEASQYERAFLSPPAEEGLTRVLEGLLFQVGRFDGVTFITMASVLIAVSLFASWLPARRATSISPVTALRYE